MSLDTNGNTYGPWWTSLSTNTNTVLFTGTGDYGIALIVSGWWRFTDFTTSGALWGHGQTTGTRLEVQTSGALDLIINHATSDVIFRTVSNTLPLGEWVFVACAIYTHNTWTSPVDNRAKLWVWRESTGLEEWALTAVLNGSGATSNDSNFIVNANGIISSPINAHASNLYIHATTVDISVSSGTDPLAQYISDETYNTLVQPMCYGTFDPYAVHARRVDGKASFGVPRTTGENWSTTIHIPFNGHVTSSSEVYWPAYVYTTMQTQPQIRVVYSLGSNNADNSSELEPPISRTRRSNIDSPAMSQLQMRI